MPPESIISLLQPMTTTQSLPHLDKDSILSAVVDNPAAIYGCYTQLHQRPGGKYAGRCPIHQGDGLNFWVYPSGRWKCYSGCNKGGDAISFVVAMHKCDFKTALSIISEKVKEPSTRNYAPVIKAVEYKECDQSLADKFHAALRRSNYMMRFLYERRGLSHAAIEQFNIGVMTSRDNISRFTFPVYDLMGKLVTIRCHLMPYRPSITEEFRKAHGKVRPVYQGLRHGVFGLGAYSVIEPTGHLFEGEADAACAGSTARLCAYSATLGQHNFTEDDIDALLEVGHRDFCIWEDNDAVGHIAAVKLAQRLSARNIESRICQIPLGYKDYTAYYVAERGKK